MGTEDLSGAIASIREEAVSTLLDQHLPKSTSPDEWDLGTLSEALQKDFNANIDVKALLSTDIKAATDSAEGFDEGAARLKVVTAVADLYEEKVVRVGAPIMRHVEKDIMLRMLDQHWREHLAGMDYLRQGIHLRGYAQKD